MSLLMETSWALDDGATQADILTALSERFSLQVGEPVATKARYYDDADAALWHADCLLWQSGSGQFCLAQAGQPVREATAPAGARFWWDFPPGPLQDTLRSLIGVRALQAVAKLQLSELDVALCDANQKTVVRARLTRSSVGGAALHYLTVKPLRGYDAELADARRSVQALVRGEADLARRALLERHALPGFKRRRAAPMPITANMPTEQAVRAMAHVMLEQAQDHVGGVIEDTDTEFLHDFRVNLRKARSLISLLKKSLPAATVDKLKPRLSSMAGATNRLRDLDVFLLAQHDYRALLPADFEPGMRELAALVQQQRVAAQAEVATYLSSAAYQADVNVCLAELSLRASLDSPAAAKPVLGLVKRQLLKRFGAIWTMSTLLHSESPDEEIHAVRIEFKKLRYLIEFFADLLPKKRSAKLLAELKKIQTVLGDFNDFSVQVDFLSGFSNDGQGEMSRALSGLIAILHVKKMEKRARIFDALDAYFSEHRAIEFSLLFEVGTSGDAA